MPAVVRHLLGIGIQDERGLLQKKLRLLLCFAIINELIDPFSHKLKSAAYLNVLRFFEECLYNLFVYNLQALTYLLTVPMSGTNFCLGAALSSPLLSSPPSDCCRQTGCRRRPPRRTSCSLAPTGEGLEGEEGAAAEEAVMRFDFLFYEDNVWPG